MHIAPVSYRTTPQSLQGLNNRNNAAQPVQPTFEGGGFMRSVATGIAALAISLTMHAQSTANQVAKLAPDSIPAKVLQFNPKNYKVEYLAPWTKTITAETLKQDSIKLDNMRKTYNAFQSIPNGWDGKGTTPDRAYQIFYTNWKTYFIDKFRYAVDTGQIPKPSSILPEGVAPGTQLKVGKIDKIDKIDDIDILGY